MKQYCYDDENGCSVAPHQSPVQLWQQKPPAHTAAPAPALLAWLPSTSTVLGCTTILTSSLIFIYLLGENTYHSPSHHLSPWLKVLFKSMYVDTPPDIGMLVSKPLPMGNLVTKDPSNCPWASHPNSRGDTMFKHRCLRLLIVNGIVVECWCFLFYRVKE